MSDVRDISSIRFQMQDKWDCRCRFHDEEEEDEDDDIRGISTPRMRSKVVGYSSRVTEGNAKTFLGLATYARIMVSEHHDEVER